jgi:serine/threonine-protein kinase
MHKQNPPIIHRDLKPSNILLLIENQNSRLVKLSDFGISTLHEFDDQSHTEGTGTVKYTAVEVTGSKKYNTKADVFSLGRIFEELFNFDINE